MSDDDYVIMYERLRQARAIAADPEYQPDGFAWSQAYRQDVLKLMRLLAVAEVDDEG